MLLERELEGTALRSGKSGRLVALALLTAIGTGPAVPAVAFSPPQSQPEARVVGGLAGDLTERLAGMNATDAAKVIVRLHDSPTDGRLAGLRRHVGRFSLGRRLAI